MESGRISHLVDQAKNCDRARTLARARAFANQGRCRTGCGVTTTAMPLGQNTPLESDYLAGKTGGACYAYVNPNVCVPASVYTLNQKSCAEVKWAETFNPYTAIYAAPARCGDPNGPPVVYSQFYANAAGEIVGRHSLGGNISGNPPVPLMTACPLPNKPDNPVLPG